MKIEKKDNVTVLITKTSEIKLVQLQAIKKRLEAELKNINDMLTLLK